MACSIAAKKVILQIINCVYLLGSIISIVAGVKLFLDLKTVSKENTTAKNRAELEAAEITCWVIMVVGPLMVIFSIFGIYSVAKERVGKIKAYWIIHSILLVFSIVGLYAHFSLDGVLSILISVAAIYLSIEVEQELRKKCPNQINLA